MIYDGRVNRAPIIEYNEPSSAWGFITL
jgi:hypothetical protein